MFGETTTPTTKIEEDIEESDDEKEEADKNLTMEVIIVIQNKETIMDETYRMLLDSGTSGWLQRNSSSSQASRITY